MMIDPVINEFIPNEVRSYFHIGDSSLIIFQTIILCSEFSNTSNVDILDRFRKSVVENVKLDINNLINRNNSKEENLKLNLHMNLFKTWDWVILQHVFINIIVITQRLYNILLCMDWYYSSNQTVL